jgi:hypothetical protein
MHEADGAFCRSGKAKRPEAFPGRKQRMRRHIDDPMQPGEDKKDGPQTQSNNRTQLPAQVVARGAQHGMQRIAGLPFERNNRPVAANRAEETKSGFGVAKWNAALQKTVEAMVRNARL